MLAPRRTPSWWRSSARSPRRLPSFAGDSRAMVQPRCEGVVAAEADVSRGREGRIDRASVREQDPDGRTSSGPDEPFGLSLLRGFPRDLLSGSLALGLIVGAGAEHA